MDAQALHHVGSDLTLAFTPDQNMHYNMHRICTKSSQKCTESESQMDRIRVTNAPNSAPNSSQKCNEYDLILHQFYTMFAPT
jgi:hypothetical protein